MTRRIFIVVSSIIFYSIWDWRLTPVLINSIKRKLLLCLRVYALAHDRRIWYWRP